MRSCWLGLGFVAIACYPGGVGVAAVDADGGEGGAPSEGPTAKNVKAPSDAVPSGQVTAPDADLVAPPDAASSSFAVTNESLTVWGVSRSFVLVVPGSYTSERMYPLVVALHGDGQEGPTLRELLRFEETSGESAIVAYPTGLEKTWDLYTPVDDDADVAFLIALVDAVRLRFRVDRTFGFGLSSGAFMVNQIACRRPSLFRGIVSHSGGAPDEPLAAHGTWDGDLVRCAGQSYGVAAMVIHGTADTAVDFSSGEHDASYWSKVNGCGAGYTAGSPAPCQRRSGCPASAAVHFCPVEGLGHALWERAAPASWAFVSAL